MPILLFIFTLVSLLMTQSVSARRKEHNINWNENNWAFSCGFKGNDLSNVRVRGEDCGKKCAQTSGCTHFAWTKWNNGTCWMKYGSVSKKDAYLTGDPNNVCGVIHSTLPTIVSGDTLYDVLATRHSAREAGACALPSSDYAVVNPVALGNIESLEYLKFHPELCGQILEVNCGYGSLDIIITNSNYGGGLDLYASTWDILTNQKPPGETSCSVALTSRNAFNLDEPRCFYKPGTDNNNPYYHNVGLLNTNGRLVVSATIDNRRGEHRGDNPYYAFDFGPIDMVTKKLFLLWMMEIFMLFICEIVNINKMNKCGVRIKLNFNLILCCMYFSQEGKSKNSSTSKNFEVRTPEVSLFSLDFSVSLYPSL
jgi:hypothetical protein